MPFTLQQFFDVFAAYNEAIWPAQVFAYALGILALIQAFQRTTGSARIISGILALFWMWMGIAYHIRYFSVVNPAAWIFGIFFALQGVLFILTGVIAGKLVFRFDRKPLPVIGGCFIAYAMAIYPLLGISFGHEYPRAPMFGVAPCPTSIFTFGLLLWAVPPVPGYLLIIPLVWSFLGLSAAANLGVPQDYGLVIAGVLGTVLVLFENRTARRPKNHSVSPANG